MCLAKLFEVYQRNIGETVCSDYCANHYFSNYASNRRTAGIQRKDRAGIHEDPKNNCETQERPANDAEDAAMLEEVSGLLEDVKTHYSADNIQLRNNWMENVNTKLRENDKNLSILKKKIDETFDISLSLLIENQRNTILNFASRVAGGDENITNEEFRRGWRCMKTTKT